ncbi:polysialyltransferase family glycosyltransferase [Microbacterium luticocti]|uniref:polysialyltransferase family glycosyltransferase n=1 Tax=Microbacterium luticocti TaxID=451764 RepID=UPI00042085D1|nr:polysialyltransferase family glycosyltransferase [Microbacterium luticocti]
MIQLFALHSGYGLTTAVAAIDAGLLPHAERVLVPVNSALVPETHVGICEDPALRPLLDRFDRIEPLNALLDPLPPTAWNPPEIEQPAWRRLLSRSWGVAGEVELFVQSPQVAPARTLLSVFRDATLGVVGDGLMTYSPLRSGMPPAVTDRIRTLVHADVVPGVRPLLFPQARRVPVPADALAGTVAEIDRATVDAHLNALCADRVPTGLVLGQYLAALGIVTAEAEQQMLADMVDRAADAGAHRVVFKPHPAAPPALADAVRGRARERGVRFVEYRGAASAEVLAARLGVGVAVAGFSTALPTLHTLFGTPIAAAGTADVLAGLTPFENSNRIPATIVDALTRPASPYADPARLQHLIDAVGYAMQPRIAACLRGRAESLLRELDPTERARYFAGQRLAQLHLPGAPRGPIARLVHGAGGFGRIEQARLTARGAGRRLQRAWKAVRAS